MSQRWIRVGRATDVWGRATDTSGPASDACGRASCFCYDARAAKRGSAMSAILVLRLSALGDIVLTSSFLQSASEHFPAARIDFVVREDLLGLAAALPGVRKVIAVSRRAGMPELLALGARLSREPYEHVFDLHSSLRSQLLTWRLRRRVRPGFAKQSLPRWFLLHAHRDVYDRFGGARPLRERMLEPLRRLGFVPRLYDTRLVLGPDARERATTFLAAAAPPCTLVAIAPGARWPSKRWPAHHFAALVQRLDAQGGVHFLVLGTAEEHALAATVTAAAPGSSHDCSGRFDILETAALLEHCRLLIGNDSGLLHVAESVGCPVLGFFGPTSPAFGYAPYRPNSRFLHRPPPCNPCSKNGSRPCHRPTHECMQNLGVDEAADAAMAILNAGRVHAPGLDPRD